MPQQSFSSLVPKATVHHHFHLALHFSLHCLLICGLAEIVAMVIDIGFVRNAFAAYSIPIMLAFIFGSSWQVITIQKKQHSFSALRRALSTEGLSIAIMEMAALAVKMLLPVVLPAVSGGLPGYVIIPLIIGFLATLPVNYFRAKRTLIKAMH